MEGAARGTGRAFDVRRRRRGPSSARDKHPLVSDACSRRADAITPATTATGKGLKLAISCKKSKRGDRRAAYFAKARAPRSRRRRRTCLICGLRRARRARVSAHPPMIQHSNGIARHTVCDFVGGVEKNRGRLAATTARQGTALSNGADGGIAAAPFYRSRYIEQTLEYALINSTQAEGQGQ